MLSCDLGVPLDGEGWGEVTVEKPVALWRSRPITAAPVSVPICFEQKVVRGYGTSVETERDWKLPLHGENSSLERK